MALTCDFFFFSFFLLLLFSGLTDINLSDSGLFTEGNSPPFESVAEIFTSRSWVVKDQTKISSDDRFCTTAAVSRARTVGADASPSLRAYLDHRGLVTRAVSRSGLAARR